MCPVLRVPNGTLNRLLEPAVAGESVLRSGGLWCYSAGAGLRTTMCSGTHSNQDAASYCLISARPTAHRAAAELPAGRDWWQVGTESIWRNSASPELAPEIL